MGETDSMSQALSPDAVMVRRLIESVAGMAWAPADHVRIRELVEHVELADRRSAAGNHGPADRAIRDAEFRRALSCAVAVGVRYGRSSPS